MTELSVSDIPGVSPTIIPYEGDWGLLGGEMVFGAVVLVCYVCHVPLPIVRELGVVGIREATRAAEGAGWTTEQDLWVCPCCKDVPNVSEIGGEVVGGS